MRRQWVLIAAIAVISAAVGGGLVWLLSSKSEPAPAAAIEPPPAPDPVEVTFGGKVEAVELTSVETPTDGVLDQLMVSVGQQVMAGQLLAKINASALESSRETARIDMERAKERLDTLEKSLPSARLEATRARTAARRAEAEYQAAKQSLERQKLLLAEGATPRLKYESTERDLARSEVEYTSLNQLAENAETRVRSIMEEMDAARRIVQDRTASLEDMEIRMASGEIESPADGWVAAVHARPGDTVSTAGPDLIQIALSLARLRIVMHPDAEVRRKLLPGMPVSVTIFEVPGPVFPGNITEIRETDVVVEFQNQGQAARPGHTGDVRVTIP